MPLNIGYIELNRNGDVVIRVYYDTTFSPVGPDQPLINGPRGYCLDVTNISGAAATVSLTSPTGGTQTFSVAQGNPVTTGPSRSRTASQMATLGFSTRGDVTGFTLTG